MNRVAFGVFTVLGMAVIVLSSVLPPTVPFVPYNFLALFFLYGAGGYLASRRARSMLSGAAGGAGLALLSAGLPLLAAVILDSQFRHDVALNALSTLPVFLIAGALCGAVGAAARNLRRA